MVHCRENPEIYVVILTGAGDKAFAAAGISMLKAMRDTSVKMGTPPEHP